MFLENHPGGPIEAHDHCKIGARYTCGLDYKLLTLDRNDDSGKTGMS
jgi:hypothetical protein